MADRFDSDNRLLRFILDAIQSAGGVLNDPTLDSDSTTQAPSVAAVRERIEGHSVLPYSAMSIPISLAEEPYRTLTLTGDAAFTSTDHAAARSVTVLIIGDSVSSALSFPVEWTFIGDAAPSSLDANKEAVLTITSFGPDISDVRAAYAAEP